MARENLQKTLRRERAADARHWAYIQTLVAENKARHRERLFLARMAGAFFVPPAPVSHGEVECDHPCPEYLNGEDCRCTLVHGGRPDADAADERRDEALWQQEQGCVAAEREADYRAHEAACTGTDGLF